MMTSADAVHSPSSGPRSPLDKGTRPRFHHQITTDRLRESSSRPPSISMVSNIKKNRKSLFKELGLDTDVAHVGSHYSSEREFGELTGLSPTPTFDTSDKDDDDRNSGRRSSVSASASQDESSAQSPSARDRPWYSRLAPRRPKIKSAATAPPAPMAGLTRLTTIALFVGVVLPSLSYYHSYGIADAGPIPHDELQIRADTPKVCKRWSQQVASLNGTLYMYGGQAKTAGDQQTNTWNNDFLTLDLSKSWDISSPPISSLPQPSGPPAVANGYLWNDYNSLFVYGGEFADNPWVQPAPPSVWKYTIASETWTEYQNPKTSAGNLSEADGIPVQRAAEGAGISVPELGTSWYFGGHLDLSTTPGWSAQIARVYLKSMLEFTHPGYTNDGVYSLASGSGAGDGGVFRNITQGGLQDDPGFNERADGILAFVPGWGERGVLIGLGGGTNESFSNDMSTLDVYDIANSVWYHQQTKGEAPSVRVNPCAVVASAPDASSFQLYLFGGQNLLPFREQVQYDDMYILSIPSFTWIKADQGGDHKPSKRAGHTCSLRDGQMIVIGGYIGNTTDCDSPGVYVFNASTLEWSLKFTAFDHPKDIHPDNSVLGASFGYKVPDPVAKVIGGDGDGHATVTTPAIGPASKGPFATGKPPVFTVTAAGNTATITAPAPGATVTAGGGGGGGGGTQPPATEPHSTGTGTGTSPGLIVAGVLAGLAGVVAAYLGFCAWLYRRQVSAYKNHLAVANRYSASSPGLSSIAAFFGRKGSGKSKNGGGLAETTAAAGGAAAAAAAQSEKRGRSHKRDISTSSAGSFNWVPATEPKGWLDDHPTPESGYSSQSPLPPPGYTGPYGPRPKHWLGESASGSGVGGNGSAALSGTTASGASAPVDVGQSQAQGQPPRRSGTTGSRGSRGSIEGLDGQEPSFFSVVIGPRRALRVVNGLEGENEPLNGSQQQH